MPDDIYRGRVAMQRRLDELFPRGLSLEVLDTELVPGVPVQTGIQAPCGRVFCSAMVMLGEPLPTLWLLRFDFTTRIDPDPWVELGRPWEAWMDGYFTMLASRRTVLTRIDSRFWTKTEIRSAGRRMLMRTRRRMGRCSGLLNPGIGAMPPSGGSRSCFRRGWRSMVRAAGVDFMPDPTTTQSRLSGR